MIFRQFLVWAQTAQSASREEAATVLARAFLESDLSDEDRADAEIAITALLDDPSPAVRRAMAVEFAAAHDAPRHAVSALASDQSDVSVPVLSLSPLLTDAELADCALTGDVYAQAAIALRQGLRESICATLAEHGAREAVISLAINASAQVSEASLRQILLRFEDDGEVREALLTRGAIGDHSLPPSLKADLVAAAARSLDQFVSGCGWMMAEKSARACREATESGLIEIAAESGFGDVSGAAELARHLREQEQLTPGLLLRALVSGNRSLLEGALCELSSLPLEWVKGLTKTWSGAGFGALYTRVKLPPQLLPVFRAALSAQDEYGLIYSAGQRPQLSRILIEKTLQAIEAMPGADLASAAALLNRLRTEAARVEARVLSTGLIAAALAPPAMEAPAIEIEPQEQGQALAQAA